MSVQKNRTPLEERILTYAFVHDCDPDKAARKVMLTIAREIDSSTSCEGLYDRLFTRTDKTQSG